MAGARGGALYVADPIEIERGLALYETAAIDPATLPPRFTPDAVERELVRHLLLPLASSGRPLGVVTLLDPVSRDLATLQRMADAGAIALSNALALETARHRADVNRAVLETAHDAFIAVDADARITVWTPQAEALFGYTAKEARGAPIDELVVPERWHAAYRAEHDALLATRTETRRFHLPAVHRDGRRLTIEVSVSPLQVGDSWQINGFVRDIGDRVAQERAREAQRAVSQALAEAGAGEDVVPRLLEALGRSLHWPVAVHWVPDPLAGEPRRAAEWRDPDYDGRELPVSVSVPIGEGPTGFGSFEFWQQRRVPLDPSLSDALDSISELVAEVLERRRAEAETEKLKNEFFALVSHELRTPLTSIIGYLELILEEEAGEVADEQRHFLTVIERNARRLLRLVGDLLFVAQVEAGTLSLERRGVDLEAVVRDAVEAGRPRAEQAGVELVAHTEPVPALDGDGDRLAQVVDNLIANAVKFTPAGGRVTVRCGRRDGSAFVEVDRHRRRHRGGRAGPPLRALLPHQGRDRGVRPGHRARPLDRACHRTRARWGSSVRERRRCWYDFHCGAAHSHPRGDATMSDEPRTVLVADDDEDILQLVSFRLERAGYTVVTAADGQQALAAARQHQPDLAVLDVMMPGLNGYEVTRQLRADPATAAIPVILLTARVQEADVSRGFEAGADDYLRKPFSPQELRSRVQAILARRSSVR